MRSLIVRVTLSPPSTRLESISAAESRLKQKKKSVFGHWLDVCKRVKKKKTHKKVSQASSEDKHLEKPCLLIKLFQ